MEGTDFTPRRASSNIPMQTFTLRRIPPFIRPVGATMGAVNGLLGAAEGFSNEHMASVGNGNRFTRGCIRSIDMGCDMRETMTCATLRCETMIFVQYKPLITSFTCCPEKPMTSRFAVTPQIVGFSFFLHESADTTMAHPSTHPPCTHH